MKYVEFAFMRHDQFMEILDDLQKVLNSGFPPVGLNASIEVHYFGGSIAIFSLESWSCDYRGTGDVCQSMNYRLLHKKLIVGSITKELFFLIEYCKKNITNANYENLNNKIKKFSDFQDLLECV